MNAHGPVWIGGIIKEFERNVFLWKVQDCCLEWRKDVSHSKEKDFYRVQNIGKKSIHPNSREILWLAWSLTHYGPAVVTQEKS